MITRNEAMEILSRGEISPDGRMIMITVQYVCPACGGVDHIQEVYSIINAVELIMEEWGSTVPCCRKCAAEEVEDEPDSSSDYDNYDNEEGGC